MTVANTEIGAFLNALTEDTTPSAANDLVMTYDASASAVKKVKLQNIPAGTPALDGCKVYNSTTQSFNATTLTYIAFDSEEYDTNTYHDNSTNNSRLTAPTTGYYRVSGLIWYATTSGVNYILFDKNHAGAYIRGGAAMFDGVGSTAFLSTTVHLTATDYIEVVGYHTQAGSIATGDSGTTPSQQNWATMEFLGT